MKRDTSVALLQFTVTLAVTLAAIVAIAFGMLIPFDVYWPLFKRHIVVSWIVCFIQWLVYMKTKHRDSEHVSLSFIIVYPLLTLLISYHTMDSWIRKGTDE